MRTLLTPRNVAQAVSYDASVASSAFAAATKVIRVVSTTNCHVVIAAAPTALTTDLLLIANVPEFFGVKAGEKIAAIKASGASAGILSIAEGAV